MLRITERPESAVLQAKSDFQFICIITDIHRDELADGGIELDGCHIFERSTHPSLQCCVENILPINRLDHSDRRFECMDFITTADAYQSHTTRNSKPLERIQFIIDRCHANHREQVKARLWTLLEGIESEIKDRELLAMVPEFRRIMEETS